jgi:superfamily II DNA or RNA helicase
MSYYKSYNDPDFANLLNKYEFKNDKVRDYIYQEPTQLLLRNIISPVTIYDKILLFHATGSGKTCSSISIAEGFKEYLGSVNRRVFVLVKNDNIKKNFIQELLGKCSDDDYVNDDERELLGDIKVDKENEVLQELKLRVKKSINKHYQFMTYGKFTNNVLGITVKRSVFDDEETQRMKEDSLQNLNNSVIIVDEVHNILGNKTYKALMQLLSRSINYKLILLTATPLYDSVDGIIYINNLLNANDPEKLMTTDVLETRIVDKTGIFKMGINTISEGGIQKIKQNLLGKISYLRENESTNPERRDMGTPINENMCSVKIINCKMSEFQFTVYKQAILEDTGKAPENFVIEDTEERSSSLYKSSSDASTMVYPNGKYGKDGFYEFIESEKGVYREGYKNILHINNVNLYSNKLYNIINNVLNGESGNVFIYSNFVTAGGTNLLRFLLLANCFRNYGGRVQNSNSFVVMDDSVTPNRREYLLRIFNSFENRNGELIRIIIGSPVLSEGITLKCIKQIHILEPFWNMSKINQIIGRGIRNNSHASLPESERFVEIYKYASISDDPELFYIDKEKYKVSEAKDRSNKVIERLLKEISIDCSFNVNRNIVTDITAQYTDKCDYTTCAYKCFVHSENDITDTSTYKSYIKFFEKYDIQFIKHSIRLLYKQSYMYTIDNIFNYLNVKVGYNLITMESLLQVLYEFINDKIVLTDIHSREGYLIKKGIYYIFNAFDKNINDTIFKNMFDFSKEENLINVSDYSMKYQRFNLEEDDVSIIRSVVSTSDDLTNEIVEYNDDLMKSYDILGSFRKRPSSNQAYGLTDNVFRLIDFGANNVSANDSLNRKRKVFGTTIGTGDHTKPYLLGIVQRLGIEMPKKQTKEILSALIRKFLIDNERVLK